MEPISVRVVRGKGGNKDSDPIRDDTLLAPHQANKPRGGGGSERRVRGAGPRAGPSHGANGWGQGWSEVWGRCVGPRGRARGGGRNSPGCHFHSKVHDTTSKLGFHRHSMINLPH